MKLIDAAYEAWVAGEDFRQRRERFKRYTYGDQWCDEYPTLQGRRLREDEIIYLSGKRPYTNNLIRQLVKTIVGRFRHIADGRGFYKKDSTRLPELDARLLEEFLISGMAVQRVGADKRVENIDPRRFFTNHVSDPLGRDIELVGQLHDLSLPEAYRRFAHGDVGRIAKIRRALLDRPDVGVGLDTLGREEEVDFYRARHGKCRVIELWTLDAVSRLMCYDAENGTYSQRPLEEAEDVELDNLYRQEQGRLQVEAVPDISYVWNCRWLSASGVLLDSYQSDCADGRHPFILRMYPLTDGEIHPFVEDVIEQQRFINRLIVMIDKMMASAAKGVLLFPLRQLPTGVTLDDVSDTWARSDGIIPVTGNGDLPQQVVTSTDAVGAYQLLEMQLRMFENISGVGDALSGRTIGGNAGAGVYDRQVENATVALSDLIETFISLIEERNEQL